MPGAILRFSWRWTACRWSGVGDAHWCHADDLAGGSHGRSCRRVTGFDEDWTAMRILDDGVVFRCGHWIE